MNKKIYGAITSVALSLAFASAPLLETVANAQQQERQAAAKPSTSARPATRPSASTRPAIKDRSPSRINRDRDRDININRNVNIDRDVQFDRNHGHRDNHHWDRWEDEWDDYQDRQMVRDVVRTVGGIIAIGVIVDSLEPDCKPVAVNGMTYYQCNGTWYQPQYAGSAIQYVVINPPK
jgi:hypothetical protein